MNTFHGMDVVAEKPVNPEILQRALATVLSVPTHRIAVINDTANYPERAAADVVCVITPIAGQYSVMFSIQCDPLDLADAPIDIGRRLAVELGFRCLLPDDRPDPYTMWMVQPGAPAMPVFLDSDALENEQYVIHDDTSQR